MFTSTDMCLQKFSYSHSLLYIIHLSVFSHSRVILACNGNLVFKNLSGIPSVCQTDPNQAHSSNKFVASRQNRQIRPNLPG